MRALSGLLVLGLVASAGCGKKNVESRPVDVVAPPADVSVATSSVRFDKGHVVLEDPSGKERWRVPVKGYLGSVRPPDRLVANDRVFVVADNALVALSAADGQRVWEAPGPADRILVHAGLVLTTDCSSPSAMQKPRFVVARKTSDGTEAFRVEIPKSVDPDAILRVGDTFFVGDARSVTAVSLSGRKLFAFDEGAIVIHPLSDDWLLATTKRIARVGPNGEKRWERPVLEHTFVGRGGVVALDPNEVVVYGYSGISDSGVELVRLRVEDGRERWRVKARPAGVDHSEYLHEATVKLSGKELRVASNGSYASFEEVFSLDGQSVSRTVSKR